MDLDLPRPMKVRQLSEGDRKWTEKCIVKERWFVRGFTLKIYAARTGDGGSTLELGVGMRDIHLLSLLEIPFRIEVGMGALAEQHTVVRDVTVRPGKVVDLGRFQLDPGSSVPRGSFTITIKSIDGGSAGARARLRPPAPAVAPPGHPPPLAVPTINQQPPPDPPPAGAAGVTLVHAAIANAAAAEVEAAAVPPPGHAAAAPAAARMAAIRLRIIRRPAAEHAVAAPADVMEE